MSKEIRLLIQERLKGFKVGVTQGDVDSSVFDNTTMLKIEELSKEFDQTLVIEIMRNKYRLSNMTIDSIPAKREVEVYQDHYLVDNISSREEVVNLSTEMCKLFDELVDSSPDSNYLVKDVDEWISRINSMKEKYGYRPFTQMYEVVHGIRKIMWSEGLPELQAGQEYAKRREEEYRQDIHRSLERMNSRKGSDNTLSRHAEIQKIREELNNGGPFFELTADQQTVKQALFIDVVHDNVSRNNFLSHLLGSSIVTTYQGSGGHGYDIPTNGGRHKKVVTGKAGNSYPIPKRRGVK